MRLPMIDNESKIVSQADISDYIHHFFGKSIDEILAPIGDNDVGESVRHNGVYFQIKEARREDDPTLPQGVWTHDLKIADWEQVEKTAIEALCHKSKDLQLGVWLMESSINRHGFAGIAPAAILIRSLCEVFWENMHPQMVDDDIEFRTNPINWINEKLSLRLRLVPITSTPMDGDELNWDDWDNAQRFEKLKQQQKEAIEWDGITVDVFKQRLTATPKEFLFQLCEQIEDAHRAIDSLISWLDERCGHDSPSLGEIIHLTDDISSLAISELSRRGIQYQQDKDRVLQTSPVEEQGAGDSAQDGSQGDMPSGNGGGSSGDGEIRSREDAFASLLKAAEFLMQDDPHSPVPYMVYTACSWGEKTAPDLYQEIFLQKGGQLNIFEVMGLALNDNNQ